MAFKKKDLAKEIDALTRKLEKEKKEDEAKKKREEQEKKEKETPELVKVFPRSPIFKDVKTLKTPLPVAPIIPYDPIINVRGFKGWLLRRHIRKNSSKYVIARVFSLNKRVNSFYVPAELDGFLYKKGRYVLDDSVSYFDDSAKMKTFDFQEPVCLSHKLSLALPVEVKNIIDQYNVAVQKGIPVDVDVEDLKRVFELDDHKDIENAVNPIVLERYLKSDFVKSLVGGSLQKVLRIIMVLIVIALLFVLVDFIIDLWDSGILQDIGESVN